MVLRISAAFKRMKHKAVRTVQGLSWLLQSPHSCYLAGSKAHISSIQPCKVDHDATSVTHSMDLNHQMEFLLCECCRGFDVHALLKAAQEAPAHPNINDTNAPLVHDAVKRYYKHRPNVTALRESAAHCDLCAAIWTDYCRARQPHELTDTSLRTGLADCQIYIGTLLWDPSTSATPHLAVHQDSQDSGPTPGRSCQQLACFEVCAEEDVLSGLPEAERVLLTRVQASSAGDPLCFELARRWLTMCQDEHAACRQSSVPSGQRPTRLLDVSTMAVRLVEGVACKGPYAALSYCWGPDRDLLLTQRSEGRLREGILVSEFPATLRDAIVVAMKLGMEYMWIDALCIFQDQERQEAKDDWAREAGRMRDVYRDALVTIEAASATRGGEGFLGRRKSSKPYCALPWIGRRASSSVSLRPFSDVTDNQLLGTKIYQRGWTLQERLLAPRTLSFGKQQMSYQCASGNVDESGRISTPPRPTEWYLSKEYMAQLRKPKGRIGQILECLGAGAIHQGEIRFRGWWKATYYRYWSEIVDRYAERQFTNPSDRLSALSGVAEEFQRATGDTYVAGMWQSELLAALGWSCISILPNVMQLVRSGTARRWLDDVKRTRYFVPSWSWASVQGRQIRSMTAGPSIHRVYARLRSVHTEPLHRTDPYGSLRSAHLVLEAPFLPMQDPFSDIEQDFVLWNLYRDCRRSVRCDIVSEAHQHHVPWDKQDFGLVKLYEQKVPKGPFEGGAVETILRLLLLESTESGHWRRLSAHDVSIGTLEEFEQMKREEIRVWDGYELKEGTMEQLKTEARISHEVEVAAWKMETITLV